LQSFCNTHGILPISKLKPFHLTRWLDSQDWQTAGRHGGIASIKRALNWAVSEGLIDNNPLKTVKTPTIDSRQRGFAVLHFVGRASLWPAPLLVSSEASFEGGRDLFLKTLSEQERPQRRDAEEQRGSRWPGQACSGESCSGATAGHMTDAPGWRGSCGTASVRAERGVASECSTAKPRCLCQT
jgi:hypothetical protein